MELNQLIRENILQLKPYSSARDEFSGVAEVYLDANENPYNHGGLNRYPDPTSLSVKQALSPIKGLPVDQIFLGNGSDEVIDVLIRVFCEPAKDNIITLPPTYGMYQVSADTNNVAVKKVALDENFQPDVAKILEAVDDRSKILFICTPNNPSGNNIDDALISQLLTLFPGIVVIDEAYNDFAGKPSWTSVLHHYPRLVVLQTFSKAWGLAGIRLGVAFASKEIVEVMNKVKAPYNVNLLTQKAALKALAKAKQTEKAVASLLRNRQKLTEELMKISLVEKVYPSDANFLLVKVKDPTGLYRYLIGQGIVVRNRDSVPLCKGCLRMTVGTIKEDKALVKAIQMYAASNNKE